MSKPAISKATVIHWSLYAALVLLLAGVITGTYLLHQQLSAYAKSVDHLRIDSDLNEQGIANAQKLRRVLSENQDNVSRAKAIVADTKYYEYQDQIVRDISAYAAAANLTVLGFDFTPTANKASSVSGLKTVVTTISLKSPVPYSNYLRFLKLIERNLTKMQVTQLDIANDLKVPGAVSSPVITIEVYVR